MYKYNFVFIYIYIYIERKKEKEFFLYNICLLIKKQACWQKNNSMFWYVMQCKPSENAEFLSEEVHAFMLTMTGNKMRKSFLIYGSTLENGSCSFAMIFLPSHCSTIFCASFFFFFDKFSITLLKVWHDKVLDEF